MSDTIMPNLAPSSAKKLRDVRLFLFDMDGTLYLGSRLFDFTKELLEAIKAAGKQYAFITNNSSKSVAAYVEKLGNMGIPAKEEEFLTSSQATAHYLNIHHRGKTLYVCGTRSLKDELSSAGFRITEDLGEVECIVMGFDTELTFKKLEDVCKILATRDVPYIATNPDYVCPTEFGSVPDCGSVCDMIFNATGKRPFVIGKPSPLMIELAMEKFGSAPPITAVVGDRMYTDIKSGAAAGALGVLVMSGETTAEMFAEMIAETIADAAEKPDIVLDNAGEIIPYL